MLSALFAVGAALFNALSSTLQRKANIDEPDAAAFSGRIILDLLHRPAWLGGILAVIAGFLLQAAALAHGELAFVEPVLVLELPFTLAIASRIFGGRLHQLEWTASLMLAAGLALLVTGLRPYGGYALRAPGYRWAIGGAAVLGAVAVMVGRALRSRGVVRAALLGVATGSVFGLTAAFTTGMSESVTHGPLRLLTAWQTWAMIGCGLLGMFLLQNALQAGSLLVVQPGLTLTDPLVSILWGVLVFDEHVHTGPWLVSEIAGALLIVLGTIRLSHSPLIRGVPPRPSEQATG
jgi:drug/metabolite transporter (DMT)-like permease